MPSLVDARHLVKRYAKADKNAVDDVSFSIHEGSFFSLLGPNGAGKTTIISILSTVLAKTEGEVTIAGYDLDKQPNLVRRELGVIFQNPSLDQNLTAEENIRFHAILYGLYPFSPTFSLMPASYKSRLFTLAELLGLKDDIFKPIRTFSGGMKRKLEIIRSLTHNPKLLILDEPTSGLDPVSRRALWEYLLDVRKRENTTILLTTHYLEEADDSDYIAVINHGEIVAEGTPADLKRQLTEAYLVVDAKDRHGLETELKGMKLNYKLDTHLRIPLNSRSAQDVIRALRTDLSHLEIQAPTLEEAYLSIIGEGK